MEEDLNGYFSSLFIREDISLLPVPDAKFQEPKSEYKFVYQLQECSLKEWKY